MDTLGTLVPPQTSRGTGEKVYQVEALERARYLALTGGKGVVSGSVGTGKTWLLDHLAPQVRREGVAVLQLNLNGVSAAEIPAMFAARLGLGLSHHAPEFEVWARLQDYAHSCRTIRRPIAFFIDHLDRARESALVPLDRLIQSFEGQTGWIFAVRKPNPSRWHEYFRQQSWLKIELREMSQLDAAHLLNQSAFHSERDLKFTKGASEAAFELSAGQLRSLKKLSELAALAAAADGLQEVDAEFLKAISKELIVSKPSA